MLRSLYAGISGMKVNQVKLDVIGNNIANAGTTAFKSSRVRFKDMVSQTVSESIAPGTKQGGVNPKQVGLGVQVAGIDTMVIQGSMQPTSRVLDVAIDGEGYLVVGSGADTYYTRDGALTQDKNGALLNSDGLKVMGYDGTGTTLSALSIPETVNVAAVDVIGTAASTNYKAAVAQVGTPASADYKVGPPVVGTAASADYKAAVAQVGTPASADYKAAVSAHTSKVESFSIEKDGTIKAFLEDNSVAVVGQIAMASFKNPAGLSKVGGNLYQGTSNSGDAVLRSKAGTTPDNSGSYGEMLSQMLEMSNVDLAEQFTDMIIAQRAFQASGKSITTGDEILQEILALKR